MLETLPENQTKKWAKKEFPGVFSYIDFSEKYICQFLFHILRNSPGDTPSIFLNIREK